MPAIQTQDELDRHYMRRALELALRGLNTTDPNPRVGCVVVRDGNIVGEGWHQRAGQPHAEVYALRTAAEAARGATAYVTLEPCAHTGRTPPCTTALIAAGLKRVVYATGDPNPLVNGAGAAALGKAGILLASDVLALEARALNPGFFKRMQLGLPWVRLKLAASLDGRTALANGASRWITGKSARQDVQRWRARSSVVLTGSGTAIADDPALNVRLEADSRQPLRVLLDSELKVAPSARLFDAPGAALVFTSHADTPRRAALEQRGVQVEQVNALEHGGLELEAVLRRLAQLHANEVLVEAGARLAGAFLRAQLVDELIVYLAPNLLGPAARPLVELPEIAQLQQRLRLRFTQCDFIGDDLRLLALPIGPESKPTALE